MTDDMDIPRDDDVLAAEFALRLLSSDDERMARHRMLDDREFAARVEAWEVHFADLAEDVKPVAPRAALRGRVMERLFGAPERRSFWSGRAPWQLLGLTSLTAAAALAVALIMAPPAPEPGGLYVTEIASENDTLRVLAVYDETTGALQINRTAGAPAAGRSLQLWGIVEGSAPVSIGLVPDDPSGRLALPEVLVPNIADLLIAISDEPAGGSPTGQPTGDVLAVGPFTEL